MKETIIFYVLILSNPNLNYNYPIESLYGKRTEGCPEVSIFYLLKLIAFPEL